MKTFYSTTPIYYANDKPHIGHAYTTIATDIICRWKRITGEKAFLLTGTDEHGSKVARAAEEAQEKPKNFLDGMVRNFIDLWPRLNIHPDDFIRTTEERHISGVQKFFSLLHDKGDIYKGEYEGLYCVPCESFFTESQLSEGACPQCRRPVENLKEESYFFKLSKYRDFLLDHYKKNPAFLQPAERAPEMLSFVSSGLRDLSVSRTRVTWGIPVPFDTSHTVYVWFDALLNYITAAGYQKDEKLFKRLWPADVHFVGKEIFKFHAVIWPAMLHAAGLPLPEKVFAHGWWTVEGEKMSKSLGNVIDPDDISKEYSVDTFRYFLFREMPFGGDGNFTRESLKRRYNAELANDLGNLFSRTIKMVEKYCDGAVPSSVTIDRASAGTVPEQVKTVAASYDALDYYRVLNNVWKLIEQANQYIEQKAPWKTAKTNPADTKQALYTLLWVLDILSVVLHPVIPETAQVMWERLGHSEKIEKRGASVITDPLSHLPVSGRPVVKGDALFPRK